MTVDLARRYPRRRSLGQRLVDAVLARIAALVFFVPVLIMDRQDRKAGAR